MLAWSRHGRRTKFPLREWRCYSTCGFRFSARAAGDGQRQVDPQPWELILHFELSMICCALLMADSSGALSFFRISIAFCAEAVASFLVPSFASICAFL